MHDLQELIQATKDMEDPFYTAELTDNFFVGKWKKCKALDEKKILEIRVFNQNREVKLFREDIGQDFRIRTLDNSGESFDEVQFLDVDEDRSNGTDYVTTGGGHYEFPFTDLKHPAVRIRHYLKHYEKSGQTYIYDWRCVGFEEGKHEKEQRHLSD